MSKKVFSPKIGQIVHSKGNDVYITSGSQIIGGRVSNWFTWRSINSDGSLSETESGYGDFTEPDNEYVVTILCTKNEK